MTQSSRDPDVVVIGSGPNGLVAANIMARRGFRVLLLEAHPRRPGGALGTEELTVPGFFHDVGAGFFPFGKLSPAFRELELENLGVHFHHARFESCHPAPDGSIACLARGSEVEDAPFGNIRDQRAFYELAQFHASIEPELLKALLLPFPALGPLLKIGPMKLLKLARLLVASGRGLATRLFETEAARRVLPSLALHVDVGPDDRFGAALGYMLALTATTGGFAVPRRGAQSITNALVTSLEKNGGRLRLAANVKRIVVRKNRARAVVLDTEEEIAFSRAVLADVAAPTLLLSLLEERAVPSWVRRRMRAFPYGWGTFKVDWALTSQVPWRLLAARQSAVVHVGESLDELSLFTRQVRAGNLPERPYLVIGQQSIADETRAPPGHHTLYCYSHVPSNLEGGWQAARERFADTIEQRIEELAPGFRSSVIARHISAPPDLQAMNANLIGGDLGGGSNAWHQQLMFRPIFPYFRYRMPVKGVYLCSSYTHPGAGVHGMCGYNAALIAARDNA